jgi:hypothetical protein
MALNHIGERDARGSNRRFDGEEEQRGGQGPERMRIRTTCATWARLTAGDAAVVRGHGAWRGLAARPRYQGQRTTNHGLGVRRRTRG